jgi:hypothetical protein
VDLAKQQWLTEFPHFSIITIYNPGVDMELLSFMIYVVVFYMAAKMLLSFLANAARLDEIQQKVMEQADRMIRIVQLEPLPDQGTILAYDKENNQFLGQGRDENELKDNIMQRFPEKVFLLNDKPFTANKKAEVRIEETIRSNTR